MTGLDPVASAQPVLARLAPLVCAFAEAGHTFALVGGIVRDLSLGAADGSTDVDATTDARPEAIKRLVAPLAHAVWAQGEKFGTIGAGIGDDDLEITTYRAEVYDPESRKPVVAFGDDLATDLSRRDFTINAMAIDAVSGVLVDPHGGLDDLRAGVLRTPLSPEVSFDDDPLRMLRAARFLARFDLTAAPELVAAMTTMAERLSIVSGERIRDEWSKLLALPAPRPGVELLATTGLLGRIESSWSDATLDRVDVAAALDDPTAGLDLRRAVFVGATADPADHHRRMRASTDQRHSIDRALELADAVAALSTEEPPPDAFVRAWRRRLGQRDLESGLRIATLRGHAATATVVSRRHAELAAVEELDRPRPPVDGAVVMDRYGITGPDVGAAMDVLESARLAGGPLDVDEALGLLDRWFATRSEGPGTEQ